MESEQIHTWLKIMQLPFTYDEETLTYRTEYSIEGRNVPISIVPYKPDWIKILVPIIDYEKIPDDKKVETLKELLFYNFSLEDVTYSMNKDGIIHSENDIPRTSNLENFHSELTAVVLGAMTFLKEIVPKVGIDEEILLI